MNHIHLWVRIGEVVGCLAHQAKDAALAAELRELLARCNDDTRIKAIAFAASKGVSVE